MAVSEFAVERVARRCSIQSSCRRLTFHIFGLRMSAEPSSSKTPLNTQPTDEPTNSTTSSKEERQFARWLKSSAWIAGIGLTTEEQEQRAKLNEDKKQEALWLRCEKWKDSLLTTSEFTMHTHTSDAFRSNCTSPLGPAVTFMMKHLNALGANVTGDHIHCQPCMQTRAGGFSPEGGILLCQDSFWSKSHMEDTLVHELIHMYDHAKFNVDWKNLRHHACSEVS